jgi:hypothetical protein
MMRAGIGEGSVDFTLALALAGGLLAVWLDERFTAWRPGTPFAVVTHAVIGGFAVIGAAGVVSLAYGIADIAFMAVVLGVFLPALVYALLAAVWMLRLLAALWGLSGR